MGSEAEPTTLEGILAQYHDMNVNFGTSAAAPVVRKNAGLPQSQSGKVLPRSRLPPREDPGHVDFTGVDLRRCWGHFLPTDDITFYDKPMRIAVVQNAALGPSDSYGADGTALIVQRGGEWLLQYKELTIFNARGSEVRTYLSSKRQSRKSRDVEDLGENGRLVPFESGVDGAHLGDAAGGAIEQRLHYAKGKVPQTLERMAATLFHPIEWIGIVLAKPSLAKPRTVGPLLYGVGNFADYKRPRNLRREILNSVNAVKERFRELERKAHASTPNLTPESHHAVAKEIFLAFGKDAADRLEWPEFRVAMDRLGFHWSTHKLRPLFHLGDMDFQGWVSFQDLKYVLMVASQLPRPGCISLWEYFAEFSQQNYGWINDFEFWKIVHCSTTIKASIEDIEKCFEEFRHYSSSKPEYILRYERFKLLWAQTVCKYGLCRTELARRGVGADLLKKHKVTPRGPWQFLLEVVERIDNWDSLCFERSKVQAYTHRRQARMAKASKLHKRTRRRVMGNVKARVSKAREDKDEARKQMVKARDQEVRLQTEQRLKEQVALEVTNREVREREVLTQLVRRKVEWQEEQIVRKGKDTLDRSHRHLWRVPTELFKGQQAQSELADIVLMKLNNNKISEVPGMDFLFWCSSLQQLDLSANRLVTLPRELGLLGNLRLLLLKDNRLCELPESLADLRELRVLTIAQNNIAKLPDAVGDLRNLQRLDAAYNLLEDLPQTFGNCTTLENLDLDTNKLRDLPRSFSQLTRLKRLKLTCNHIRQLPADFGALRELEVLEVQTNQLERLPETIGQCARLQIVMLQRNNIRMLPKSFCQLSQLKELDLSRNSLLEVPAFFGGLGQLQVLDVSFNQCLELPASIGDIKYLRTLDCSNNRLSSVPAEIGALQLLEKFDASTNQIEGPMPLGLGTMYSLVRLNLSHNQITRLPANIGHLRHLDFMDISFNAFPSLPEALGNLVKLRYLNCSTNKLSSLPWNARNLANLEELNCSANSIQYLPREVGAMTKLRRLNVYNNKLRALPAELGGIIDNLEEFDAMRNPFTDFPEKWCANWTLSDQYTTLWSGYTNEEVKTWLKMLMHVYPVCVNVWEAHKQLWHTAEARVLAFVQEVRKQCEAHSSWSNDLIPVVRGFYMYSKKHGVIPQYHQPYPGEPEELKQQREEWDRAKDIKVIRARNSLDGFLEDQERAYRFKQEKLNRIEVRFFLCFFLYFAFTVLGSCTLPLSRNLSLFSMSGPARRVSSRDARRKEAVHCRPARRG
eukprot:INCI16350.4.p1 GENE.INCI16350.4~~INCI16350.4.p1  ORF type:complete len:1412 (+),score=255.21 INCI16350.4:470-4237(+)